MSLGCNFCRIGSKLMRRDSDNCLSDIEARLLLKSSPSLSIKEKSLSTTSSPVHKRISTPSTSSGHRSDKLTRRQKFWNNLKQKTSVHFRSKTSDSGASQEREESSKKKRSKWDAKLESASKAMNKDRFKRFLNLDFTRAEHEADEISDDIFLTPTTLEDVEGSILLAEGIGKTLHPENTTFCLNIHLKEGKDLVVKDRCGTSDPYVKFKIGTKLLYKSRIIERNLNPTWNERFTLRIEDLGVPVQVQVYDHDLGLLMDDFMGEAYIEPSTLCLDQQVDLKLTLTENKKNNRCSYMGHLLLQCSLTVSIHDELTGQSEKISFKSKSSADIFKKKKRPPKAVVNIVLVEAFKLRSMDDNGFSDPYVKFQLGSEKCKSKFKVKTLNPRWLESFDMEWMEHDPSWLDVNVFDHDVGGKDDVLGRTKLDLSCYSMNTTHHLRVPLEDGGGHLLILLTICSTLPSVVVASSDYDPQERFGLNNTFKNLQEIGELTVTVHQARDLLAADIGGKSDPYCVLELVNTRLQTQTDFKTLNPQWGRTFVIPVSDVHSVLEVTVYDYDRSRKSEFLGRIAIPLLRIHNSERKWYILKDKKLQQPSKGSIEIEMCLHFNHLRAVVRTLNPREEKLVLPETTFKLATMKTNIDRVFRLIEGVVKFTDFIDFCFKWENPFHSFIAFVTFMVIVWNVEAYMIPIALIILLLKNYLALQSTGDLFKDQLPQEYCDQEKKENEANAKEEKKPQSLRERLQTVQDVCLQVQETMDAFASLVERVQNVFLWKVPWLSILGIICLALISCVLYLVPLRTLMMLWGVLRFSRRWRVGNNVPNNELLDFLSRVPSNKELVEYREYLEVSTR